MEESRQAKTHYKLAYGALMFMFLVGLTLALLGMSKKGSPCTENYRNDGQVKASQISIQVQIAATDMQRQQGLGGKRCLADNQGMLFRFDQPGYYPFWMKDMNFPIDIVWISPAHQVTDIKANLSPSTYPQSFTNSRPAQAVLELGAGQAARDGIKTGSRLNY